MKRCPKCSIRYSDMWNICGICNIPLEQDSIVTKILSKTRHSGDYLYPLLERTIDQADALFLYLDKNLKPVMCNKAIEAITGYTRGDIFKGDWLKLLFKNHDSRKEIFKVVITSCLSSIKSRAYRGGITKKDGAECILSWRNTAVVDAAGNISGVLCIAQDVTDHKSFEDDIAAQSEGLKEIFASIKDYALITTNLESKITYYGVGAVALFGWKNDMTLHDISTLFPENNRYKIKSRIGELIKGSQGFEEEVTLLKSDGESFPAILTVSAILDKKNEKAGFVYVVRDMTERKKLERQMVQTEELAAIGQLAAGVAHEINNPLLVILGRLDMLSMADVKVDEQVQKTMDHIKNQAQRIRSITERLLSYSRRKVSRMDTVDLNEVLKTISPLIAYHPEFKNVIWKNELQENLPKIKGDFNQMQEVFLNLSLNGCQAMPKGGTITICSEDTGDGFVEIIVKDSGSGIKDDMLEKIFNPFFTTKDKGTGLGLAICQDIVNAHGGKIEAESSPDIGTIFRVRLPAESKG